MNPYESLANAIILAAVDDYRASLRCLSRNPRNQMSLSTKTECERFFHSDLFGTLTKLDPDVLMKKLQMEVQ